MSASLDRDDLLALERDGWESLCRAEGALFYRGLLTVDAVMILPDGTILERASIIERFTKCPTWVGFELSDVRLVPAGADSAALVYHAVATREGHEEPFVALIASVYRVVDGKPLLAIVQHANTPLD